MLLCLIGLSTFKDTAICCGLNYLVGGPIINKQCASRLNQEYLVMIQCTSGTALVLLNRFFTNLVISLMFKEFFLIISLLGKNPYIVQHILGSAIMLLNKALKDVPFLC